MEVVWRDRFGVSRARLWPYVSDTDRMSRWAGFPPVTYRTEGRPDGTRPTVATARLGPFLFRWEEAPYTWEAPARFSVARRLLGGPFASVRTEVVLTEEECGTLVEQRTEVVPRNALGRALAPAFLAYGRRGVARAYRKMAAALAAEPVPGPAVSSPLAERLLRALRAERALVAVRDDACRLAPQLAEHIERADDRDLARIRPYALADALGLERRLVLALLLAATRAGLLDLSWDVLCPGCRGPQGRYETLEGLREHVHCPGCDIDYGPELDRNVEVTFSAAPLGRGLDVPTYCGMGPHMHREILAQGIVPPGGSLEVPFELASGSYVLEAGPNRFARFAVASDAPAGALAATVEPDAIAVADPAVRAGAGRIAVENRCTAPALVRVCDSELPHAVATAADVTALQEFRDLFSSEVLAHGLELSVRSLTIVFSDLVGSTHLYSETGDAPAFRIVREHFDVLRELIATYRGAIVKTIGDAVMAVFADPGDAFEAALRFAPAVGVVRGPSGPLEIRVGLHTGPCIAMRANDHLDYFGTTVNLAARIQHVARSAEVVLSATSALHPALAPRLADRPSTVEEVSFKGIPDPVGIVRLPAHGAPAVVL